MSLEENRRFEDRQQRYYSQEINRTLPMRGSIAASALELALGNVDPTMPRETRMAPEIQALTSDLNMQSDALKREATCRAMPYPGPAMRAADARTGCGWWFVEDPSQKSIGAYGTRRGPMDPTLGTRTSGEWIWDPREAYKRESQKEAITVRSCKDVENPILLQNRKIGWCNSTNKAIATDGNGNPAYPQSLGGDCPDNNITMPGQRCPAPPPPTPWQQLTGLSPTVPAVADICEPKNGVLSPGCLASVSSSVMGSNGVMTQSYRSGYAGSSDTFNETNRYLQERGFSIDQGVIRDGRITLDKALATFKAVKTQADAVDGSKMTAAAGNLAYGTPFNPCPTKADDKGPFEMQCIKKAALDMGFGNNAELFLNKDYPTYWKTWGEIMNDLRTWKRTADDPNFDRRKGRQTQAIKVVYGVNVLYPKTGCNTYGIFLYRYFFPTWDPVLFPVKGAHTHFLGRYILKKGFPSQGSTVQDQTPGGGYLTEGQRMVADFYPAVSGNYQFLIQCDDFVRVQINGQVIGEVGCCGVPTPTRTVQMSVEQSYKMVVDLYNKGGPWSFIIKMSVNGKPWADIPVDQLKTPKDRRLAMFELAFNKMATGTTGAISDTNNLFQNLQISNSTIGELDGRKCLVVKGSGSNVNNNARFAQGIRVCAMKSITFMVQVTTSNIHGNSLPTIVSFYNTEDTQITLNPNRPIEEPVNPEFTDLGCWNDGWDRALTSNHDAISHTPNTCGAKAKSLGHKYFSVQNGNACFSGNSGYDKHGRAGGPCPNGGRPWVAHVWQTPSTTSFKDLGCWYDRSDRMLKGSYQGRTFTEKTCGAKAVALGHKYFSVQDDNECFTGNEPYDRYGKVPGHCGEGGGPMKAHVWEVVPASQAPPVSVKYKPWYLPAELGFADFQGVLLPIGNTSKESERFQGPVPPLPKKQWIHVAFVWDDDFKGSTLYMNGVAYKHRFPTRFPPDFILEQIRIGCDIHNSAGWTGGIAWFRAFDYKLSEELVKRDMADDWESLESNET